MKNIIIPGFSTNSKLFEDFMKFFPDAEVLENKTNSYLEIKTQLDNKSNNEMINLFGWSLGSLFALKYSIENPGKINSIFLTGATARFTEKENYSNGINRLKLEKMARLIERKKELVMNDFYNTILDKVKDKEKHLTILKENMSDEISLANGLNELLETDLLNRVSAIKIPVFICQGKADSTTPLAGAVILHELMKNSKLYIYEIGHCFFLENPELCAEKWKELICL
jgi:pimeloyl-[acyl-carrier protein] methyl ester esterase